MKIVAINGSSNEKGNTYHSLKIMNEIFEQNNIDLEIIHVGKLTLKGCTGCGFCIKNRKCVVDDEVNSIVDKLREADGIILASPVYFAGLSGQIKTFLDRAFYVLGQDLRYKPAASVVAVRRTGGSATFDQLNHFLTYSQTFLVTSDYWNIIHGQKIGEISEDIEGVHTLKTLATNMTYLLKVLEDSKVSKPEVIEKPWMNFIR